jgi:hypothetical protein
MKKKPLSPVIFLAFIIFICMLLTIISNNIGAQKTSQVHDANVDQVGYVQDETNDLMIWESLSHHLLSVTR